MTFISKMAKVGLAAHLQVQQDNQRTLDHQAAVRKARSQQHLKITEAQMNQLAGNNGAPKTADLEPDDMGNILIDSPTNHYYPSTPGQTPPKPAPSFLSKALPYIATAAIAAGAGGLGSWLAKPASTTPPASVVTNTSTASGFTLDLGDKK